VVTGAAVILLVSGALNLIVGLIALNGDARFSLPAGDVGARVIGAVLLISGGLQVLAGWLVLRLRPGGRVLGIVLASLGILGGLLQIRSAGTTGLLAMLLNGFVLYGLIAFGFVFEQASSAR
jgi:hypothetical protein